MQMQTTHEMNNGSSAETRDTLLMLSGAALVLFGAGLLLTNPTIRRLLGGVGVGGLLEAAGPDFERYMKLKAM